LPVSKAIDEDGALLGEIALADQIAAGVEAASAVRQAEHQLPVLLAQPGVHLQLPEEIVERVLEGGHQAPANFLFTAGPDSG
jgi:hypothetical protein